LNNFNNLINVVQINSFDQKVYLTVSKIPYGKVATYGQLADLICEYGRARQVGWALRRLKLPSTIPWHRVINAKGEVTMSFSRNGTDWIQKELLINEGIKFNSKMKIDIKKYLWRAKELPYT
tara:strand:+ start:268 stop:633 length:366 start_codon:yes stop_codon:yes gene_type:complete